MERPVWTSTGRPTTLLAGRPVSGRLDEVVGPWTLLFRLHGPAKGTPGRVQASDS